VNTVTRTFKFPSGAAALNFYGAALQAALVDTRGTQFVYKSTQQGKLVTIETVESTMPTLETFAAASGGTIKLEPKKSAAKGAV
jgi:hypothetical protein